MLINIINGIIIFKVFIRYLCIIVYVLNKTKNGNKYSNYYNRVFFFYFILIGNLVFEFLGTQV